MSRESSRETNISSVVRSVIGVEMGKYLMVHRVGFVRRLCMTLVRGVLERVLVPGVLYLT